MNLDLHIVYPVQHMSMSYDVALQLGRVPSVLFGLPGNKQRLLALPQNEINKYVSLKRLSQRLAREVLKELGQICR